MKYYYKSDYYEAKLKVDTEADTAFLKRNGEDEIKLDDNTKIEADIVGAGNKISEEEYES